MKVSLNGLREFLDLHKSPQELENILTSIGLEVEGWDVVRPTEVDLDKVVTAQVVACERIPDTDHLSATQVRVSPTDDKPLSIVCGAPNVAVGQKVLVALPGAQVFSKNGQLFQIAERKVRGLLSQGMICAPDELGMGNDHSGIMVLPDETPLGISAARLFQQTADIVFEIGLTPNRADATSHWGVAKDLAAWLRVNEGWKGTLRAPAPPVFDNKNLPVFPVEVKNTTACPRYTGILLKNITVQESPDWLKNRLTAIGQRPINNVVDITNWVRAELGQPLHAFDAAKIAGSKIIVTTLPADTVFKTLDEVERKLYDTDLMICDANSQPMCIGGVFGGFGSGVSDGTTEVFLESAHFHPSFIRRSMLRHGLRTDAAWTFEKGSDPNICLIALSRAVSMLQELAGAEVASQVVDCYPNPIQPARVRMNYSRIDKLVGEDLTREQVNTVLAALEIGIEEETERSFTAVIPTNKPDVTREADVVEEFLRIYGLDTVPIPKQFKASVETTPQPAFEAIREHVANLLAAQGFNECMSLSLTPNAHHHGEAALLHLPVAQLVKVHNTANPGLDTLRPSLIFSLLDVIRYNQSRQQKHLRLFEFGKTYAQTPTDTAPVFTETERLALALTGAHQPESWHPVAKTEVDFYTLKSIVQLLLARLGLTHFQEMTIAEKPFQFALRYHRGTAEWVTFGKIEPAICKKMDLKNEVFVADFHFENIFKALKNNKVRFQPLSRFPSVRRDLALVVDKKIQFSEIRALADKTIKKILKEVNLFDVFEDTEKLGAGKKSYAVSFIFEDTEKTLQDQEIDTTMNLLQRVYEEKLGASIRRG